MYFIITIDTEGDNQWDVNGRKNITTENAKYLPRFQKLCEEYGFKPTYLTSYEMAQDGFFVKFAKSCLKNGTCEIGAHPHGWSCPPNYSLTSDDFKYGSFMAEYPEDIIFQKTEYLKKNLESVFETQITSHRSGRWSLNKTQVKILNSLHFKVDSSVTPAVSWKDQLGNLKGSCGTDYTNFPISPYFIDLEDISKPGNSQLLELPMTIKNNYPPLLRTIHDYFKKGYCEKAMHFLFCHPFTWFRPTLKNTAAILRLIENRFDENSDYLMFMLHSSEFMPGGGPIFKTPDDIERLFGNLVKIFAAINRVKAKPVTCNEYYKIFSDRHGNI
jgi:hypothetical protein